MFDPNSLIQSVHAADQCHEGEFRLELIRFDEHPVHQVPTYFFRMIDQKTETEFGTINLRLGSSAHLRLYAGHIGFAVHEAHRGHHYAARALRALKPLAHQLGIDPLWITCDPDNQASRRTLISAGALFVEEIEVPADNVIFRNGKKAKLRYRLSTAP